MLWRRPAALRVSIVLPLTDLPRAIPSHSRYVFGPATVSCVKVSLSYMPPVEAAKSVSIASTPAQVPFRTEEFSTGFSAKALANSAVPLFRTSAIQSSPGCRAVDPIGIRISSFSGDPSAMLCVSARAWPRTYAYRESRRSVPAFRTVRTAKDGMWPPASGQRPVACDEATATYRRWGGWLSEARVTTRTDKPPFQGSQF